MTNKPKMPAERRRVVVTGLGLITAVSHRVEEFWQAMLGGVSGVDRIRQFDPSDLPCQIAGEVKDFNPADYMSAKEARRIARASQLGVASAVMAFDDAGLNDGLPDPLRSGVYFGTAIGGFERAEEAMYAYRDYGLARVNPFAVPSALPNMPAFYIAQQFGFGGISSTITTACATGTQTVGEAAEAIRNYRADLVLAGGVEGLITPYVIAGFSVMRALPTSFNDDPGRASRPFDAQREGFILSEGAASLMLESLEHAQARGARIYAEVLGHSSVNDGYHVAAPDPEALAPIRAMQLAMDDAGVSAEDVDYINAHGTSTPANDKTETLAIHKLFGERASRIPVSSTKSMIGHAMGASGAIEAAVCALTLYHGEIHPTINYEFPDPDCDLDYVPNLPRKADVRLTLSNSFGLGAQSACLVMGKVE